MTDHHDFGDHDDYPIFEEPHAGHDDPGHLEPPAYEEHLFEADDHDWHEPVAVEHHEIPDEPVAAEDAAPFAGADEPAEDPLEVFPPVLDVGDLPEPVDGFPWIDTGSLGIVHAAADGAVDPVNPQELAEYAGVDLPPAADPWAALAESEDPATSALARWWQEN